MSKFNDDTRENIQNDLAYLEVPDEDDFAAFIQAIADGIEAHEHVQWGGPGSGTGDAALLTPALGPDGDLPDEAQGPGGAISDKAIDNTDTWKKLLPSHPHLAAEAAPLAWEGPAAQHQAWCITSGGGYVFVGLLERPAVIVKIDPATMETVSFWTAPEGIAYARSLLYLDDYLYTGIASAQGELTKIDPATMQTVSTWNLEDAVYNFWSLTTDGTFIYTGDHTRTGCIRKIDPSTWQIVDTWNYTATLRYCYDLCYLVHA